MSKFLKDQVDPKRFIGKAFTKRKAFSNSVSDYAINIDGLTASRIMKKTAARPAGGLVVVPHRSLFSAQHASER